MFYFYLHQYLIKVAKTALFITLTLIGTIGHAQPVKWKENKHLMVVSYNVENLFDTIKNPNTIDEFTPNSIKKWDPQKYQLKLHNIAKVIRDINPDEFPEIVGLVEVENKTVLNNLVGCAEIKQANYKVVHEDSPDPRGIDCALLYRPDVFKYLNHKAIEVRFENNRRTRDILYVKGLIRKDTLHVFVNHWSSRMKGKAESESKRLQCAKGLRHCVDSVLYSNPLANIIILGDFNDNPSNISLLEVLGAGKPVSQKALKNIMYQLFEQGKGSYWYKGNFEMLDNLIVSKNLTTKNKGLRLYENCGWIYNPEILTKTQKNGDKAPFSTYKGVKYLGGFSDHFPIYTVFYEK